jgi:peroxiredoxin
LFAEILLGPPQTTLPERGVLMSPLALGSAAPAFSLPGVDDKVHSLDDYRDAPALVVFFSCNHCPYVQAYENRLIALQREFSDRGVRFVAINSNDEVNYPQDSFPRMRERARERNFNFDYLRDESQEIAHTFGAQRTPEAFVFDAERRLRYIGGIDDSWDNPQAVKKTPLRDAIQAVLEGREPSPKSTPAVGCTIKWKH